MLKILYKKFKVIIMKIKYLLLACLMLAILTVGAASASQDISPDGNLTAVPEEVQEVSSHDDGEDSLGESVKADVFNVNYEKSIAVNSKASVLDVYYYDNDVSGNLTVTVGDDIDPSYNRIFSEDASVYLSDLNINAEGTYKISANFHPKSGSVIHLIDYDLTVTGKEGYDGLSVFIGNTEVNLPNDDTEDYQFYNAGDFVYITPNSGLNGDVLIYLDGELYFNKTLPLDDSYLDYYDEDYVINLGDLNRKPGVGKHFVEVKYDNGSDVFLVKSRMITISYYVYFEYISLDKTGENVEALIYLPSDATGNLYVTFEGKKYKVNYKKSDEYVPAFGEVLIPAKSLKLNKKYNIKLQLTNDPLYPDVAGEDSFSIKPYILRPYTSMSVNEKQYVEIRLPSTYSGTFKLYDSKNKLVSSVKVAKGKAKIPISGLKEGYHYFTAKYVDGKYVYEEEFYVDVEKNVGGISASVSASKINVGKSVTVKIQGPRILDHNFEVSVDGDYEIDKHDVIVSKDGVVSFSVPFKTAGQHAIKLVISGWYGLDDENHYFYSNTFHIVVKDVVKLTIKKVKVKRSAKKLVLTATLKINGKVPKKGTKITFKFKGKKYIGKTNAKGVAKIKVAKKVLKKLKKGKKVTYSATYGKVTKKVTVKVKK